MDTQQQEKFKILVVGDVCKDIYQFGEVSRLSPEAPVPIFKIDNTVTKDGMAANVVDNLKKLGCDVHGVFGQHSTKTRLIDQRSQQQITRIDQDVLSHVAYIPAFYYDSIVFSDYGKGTVSYELIEDTRKRFSGPIFVDTKKTDLKRFEGCIVKINELESNHISTECSDLIITRGRGMVSFRNRLFSVPDTEVVDVCGAGDTFLSALCFCYLKTSDLIESIRFAISAASVTVKHRGVYAPSLSEII